MAPVYGLVNIGATCYMNAIVQMICRTDAFWRGAPSASPVWQLLGHIRDGLRLGHVSPVALWRAIRHFAPSVGYPELAHPGHQDAREFWDLLADELCPNIRRICNWVTRTVLTCRACGHVLERANEGHPSMHLPPAPTLVAAFKTYFDPEALPEYVCDECHRRGSVTQVRKLAEVPDVLIVQLNQDARKVRVDYPLEFIVNKRSYLLRAVICHAGSRGGGHYWTLCRIGDAWYRLDDMNVSAARDVLREVTDIPEACMLVFDRGT